jgi:transcriptional regulator with XRE-family HTH domain
MGLGMRLKEIREKREISQRQLARAADISSATISRIESGRVKDLGGEALKNLAGVLGVTVDYLVGKTDRLTPEDVVRSDDKARYLFRGFEELSGRGRTELIRFLDYLREKEKQDGDGSR